MLTVDENKRIVISLKLFWGIVIFLVGVAFVAGVQITNLKTSDYAQNVELTDHNARIKALEATQAQIATNTAVMNEKLDAIQDDISEIKLSQKELAGR